MTALYTIAIYLYRMGLWIASPFSAKLRKMLWGRLQTLNQLAKLQDKPTAWFHCASLGEFEQGRPLIESFREEFPQYQIVVSFFSSSGYEYRKNYPNAEVVCYLPFDTPTNVQRFLKAVKPQIAFFIRYEFWNNYLQALKKSSVPTVLVSAIFREEQLFFQPRIPFFREILTTFTHIFVQNRQSQNLLEGIGLANKTTIVGDTRFDRVAHIAYTRKAIPLAETFKNNQKLIVLGSIWPEDFIILMPFLNSFDKPLKVIIAPHEINDKQMSLWQNQLTKNSVRLSEAKAQTVAQFDILFIDTIGLLSSIYQFAEYAYVGGAFGKGLHSILEAATFGMPIFFGSKNYRKFKEANELLALGSAFTISDTASFEKTFIELYENPYRWQSKAILSQEYVQKNVGATQQIISWVKQENLG
jgi:3-deoxy-D-manno-octulosonic-acid transferase